MRTTVDLPDDLYRAAASLAHDRGESLSQTVALLVRRALTPSGISERVRNQETTGLPVVWVGRPVTTEMVRIAVDDK